MNITITPTPTIEGSCDNCDRYVMAFLESKKSGREIVRPYEFVYHTSIGFERIYSMGIRLCPDCMKEFAEKMKDLLGEF